jgi:hypothetical protein
VTFWYGSGSSESGRPKNIRNLRARIRIRNTGTFTSIFITKSHEEVTKTVEIKVFLKDPDPYLLLTDPDADPGGAKT